MRKSAKRIPKLKPQAPMLIMRGLVNDKLEIRERMAVQAIVGGWATPEHFRTIADMQSVMLLAGSTEPSRKWAYDYCADVVGPVLKKISDRFENRKVISATTGERKILGEFVTRYREFWLRQPMELYEAACVALTEHYSKMFEKEAA